MAEQHPLPDRRVVQCNFRVATSECVAGARAYVLNYHAATHRVELLARSRSGRWVRKWENARRLMGFRFKTIPPEHTLYERLWDTSWAEGGVERLREESTKPLGDDGE